MARLVLDMARYYAHHHLGRETIATLARLRERDITLTFATVVMLLEMWHILGTLH